MIYLINSIFYLCIIGIFKLFGLMIIGFCPFLGIFITIISFLLMLCIINNHFKINIKREIFKDNKNIFSYCDGEITDIQFIESNTIESNNHHSIIPKDFIDLLYGEDIVAIFINNNSLGNIRYAPFDSTWNYKIYNSNQKKQMFIDKSIKYVNSFNNNSDHIIAVDYIFDLSIFPFLFFMNLFSKIFHPLIEILCNDKNVLQGTKLSFIYGKHTTAIFMGRSLLDPTIKVGQIVVGGQTILGKKVNV